MEQNFEISADVMDVIDSICEEGNTPEEKECVKGYLLDVITDACGLINIDYHDTYGLFWGGGRVRAFEVATAADDEHRMKHVVEQIGQKCAQISSFGKIMLYLKCCDKNMLKMDEMNALNDWLSELDNEINVVWGFSKNCDPDYLRAIVLVQ